MNWILSKDIIFTLNEQSLFFFPRKKLGVNTSKILTHKELDTFKRYCIALNEQSLYFFPKKINNE